MRNFYEVLGHHILSPERYLKNWEKSLDLVGDGTTLLKNRAQSLATRVSSLWSIFNTNKENLEKYYMDIPDFHDAYLASFLLPNIEKVFALLARDENSIFFQSILQRENDEIVIADFGCGPLSATVGVLCLLEWILGKKEHLTPPKKIIVYALDRAGSTPATGRQLLEKSLLGGCQVEIEHLPSPAKMKKNVDILLSVNIFNEIPKKHRLNTLKILYEKTSENGLIFLMEPGQEEHARALGVLRNEFLEKQENVDIISPCPHRMACPLSSSAERKDWCWFRHNWNPPAALKLIDKFTKIDHHEINFSYLFMQKTSLNMVRRFFARCVSDSFNMDFLRHPSALEYARKNLLAGEEEELLELLNKENNVIQKVLLCTETGRLQGALTSPLLREQVRGRRISFTTDLPLRIQERSFSNLDE